MNTLTEPIELLQAYAHEQDQAAFRRLMERYFRFVFGVALRVTGSSGMAEEVCQDVFLLLSQQSRKLLTKQVNLAGWLHRVAWNKAQNMRVREQRGRQRDRKFAMEASVGLLLPAGFPESLDEALEQLKEADRTVLLCHYVDQLSFKQIAERLGISAEAAQQRSIRALRHLAELMKEPSAAAAADSWSALLPPLLLPVLPDLAVDRWLEQTMVAMTQASAKLSFAAKAGAVLASGKGIAAVMALVIVPLSIHHYQAAPVAAVSPTAISSAPPVAPAGIVVAPASSAPAVIPQLPEPPPPGPAQAVAPAVAAPAEPPPAPAVSSSGTEPPKLASATGQAPQAVPTSATLPVAKIKIGVLPALMKFDVTKFTVQPGQKVFLLFSNERCPLQHNLSILKPGTKDKVSDAALKAMADPSFMERHCFVDSPDVLFRGSKLVGPRQSDLLEFIAPMEPADYPYLCTFSGHTVMMHGIMEVRPAK